MKSPDDTVPTLLSPGKVIYPSLAAATAAVETLGYDQMLMAGVGNTSAAIWYEEDGELVELTRELPPT